MARKPTTDTLPPAVEVWSDDIKDGHFMLVEQLPFTPSRFILARGYATRKAAEADAWQLVTRRGASQAMVRHAMEQAAARTAERGAKKARQADGG